MSFLDDPIKAKRAFWISFILLLVFFLSTVILGFLFYQSYKNYKALKTENQRLTNLPTPSPSVSASSNANIDDLTKENLDLKLEKMNLEKQIADDKTKDEKAKAYNDFFKYMNSIIVAHNGFDGWTEAEYLTARGKAEATGDGSFVSTIDWAWHDTNTAALDRLIKVWTSIDQGIGNNL